MSRKIKVNGKTVKTKKKPQKNSSINRKRSLRNRKVSSVVPASVGHIALYNEMGRNIGSLQGKGGFEIYQTLRNYFISIISDPQKMKAYMIDDQHYRLIEKVRFFDPAYLDNMTFSLLLKIKAPEYYNEGIEKIDKYIRPKKRDENFKHLYQECGALLALILVHYEGISRRQAFWIAKQLTKYSESTIEKSYRRMHDLGRDLKEDIPPLLLLIGHW